MLRSVDSQGCQAIIVPIEKGDNIIVTYDDIADDPTLTVFFSSWMDKFDEDYGILAMVDPKNILGLIEDAAYRSTGKRRPAIATFLYIVKSQLASPEAWAEFMRKGP